MEIAAVNAISSSSAGLDVTGTVNVNNTTETLPTNVILRGGTLTGVGGTYPGGYGHYSVTLANTIISHVGDVTSTIDAPGGVNLYLDRTVTFNVANGASATDLLVSAIIKPLGAATAGVTKTGPGTLALTGANTYTGPTAVNGGTLLVGNTIGSGTGTGAVNVSGGTLGGNGTIATGGANVTLSGGGKLAPGMSAGTLTFTLGSGVLDISGVESQGLLFDLAAVGSSDLVHITSGSLNIGNGALEFGDFEFTTLAGFGLGTYTLFDTPQAIDGSLGPNVWGQVGGHSGYLLLSADGSDLLLTVLPEPASLVLWASGGLCLLVLAARRRRRG